MTEYTSEGEYMSGKELEKSLERGDDEPVVTIDFHTEVEFDEEDKKTGEVRKVKKIVLSLSDSDQKIVVGKVHGGGDRKTVLINNYGGDPTGWKGKKLQLYVKGTQMGPGVMFRTVREMEKMGTIEKGPF